MKNGNQGKNVVLVTGATSGLGASIAARLDKDRYSVYGTGRDPKASNLGNSAGTSFLAMDVQNETSIAAALAKIVEKEGRLDTLIACAGMGVGGSVEDTAMADIAYQIDVNFLGAVRTVKACLPIMRGQGGGKIVIVGSLAGKTGLPFQAFYSASKFALEGFVESLRYEVGGFGIDACIVEPGDLQTGFTDARRKPKTISEPYKASYGKTMAIYEHDERSGGSADAAAAAIVKMVAKRRLPLRMSVGPAFQRVALFLKRLMPAKLFEFGYRKYYKMG